MTDAIKLEPSSGVRLAEGLVLRRPLGAGGMGSVWVAQHERMHVEVAVKFLAPGLRAVSTYQERLMREAMSAARVKSGHSIAVYDCVPESEFGPFVVMELLEGRSLHARLKDEPKLSDREIVDVAYQVAEVLDQAHTAGVIHRDIKPSNLFLCDGARTFVKVLDFGIARLADALEPLTEEGAVIGTPAYMAPEQLRNEAPNGSMDRFALGLVLFECLTGAQALTSQMVRNLGLGAFQLLPAPSSRNEARSSQVDAWFAKVCAFDSSHRFATARELAQALAEALRFPEELEHKLVATKWVQNASSSQALEETVSQQLDPLAVSKANTVVNGLGLIEAVASPTPSKGDTKVATDPLRFQNSDDLNVVERAPQKRVASQGVSRRVLFGTAAVVVMAAGAYGLRQSIDRASGGSTGVPIATTILQGASSTLTPDSANRPDASAGAEQLPRPGEPYDLAMVGDFSGADRRRGQAMRAAVETAVQLFRQQQRSVTFLALDDQGDGGEFLKTQVKKASEQARIVLGPTLSTQALSSEPVVFGGNRLQLLASATTPKLVSLRSSENRVAFRTTPSDTHQAKALALLLKRSSCERIAIVASDDGYGRPYLESMQDTIVRQGGKLVRATFVPTAERADYRAVLQEVAGSRATCEVLLMGPASAARYLIDSRAKGGRSVRTFAGDTLGTLDFIELGRGDRNAAENNAKASVAEGVRGVRVAYAPTYRPAYGYFARIFREQGREGLDEPFVAHAFDAAVLALLTLATARTAPLEVQRKSLLAVASGGRAYGPMDLDRLLPALARDEDVDYQGASGDVDIDANGEVRGDCVEWEIRDGKVVEGQRINQSP
jgi:serine/threonine protein kinase/ABC-type branched-subunit amino acid transport system substrate-binding protein